LKRELQIGTKFTQSQLLTSLPPNALSI